MSLGLLLVILAGMYKFNYLASQTGYDVDGNKIAPTVQSFSPQDTTYTIDNQSVTLVAGAAETEAAPGSATKVSTNYFGNEVRTDLNNDGREDMVFLLTQSTGGTGTFFYAVAALNTEAGWVGSQGYFLGDRIAPQTTEKSQNPSHQNVIVVNYMERSEDQAMTEQPSIGKSVWLKLDTQTMAFAEVGQDFAGEANPDMMELQKKPWTWVRTTYNNDTELVPVEAGVFTITFADNNTFSVTTDCNAMGGQYTVNNNQIIFDRMMATEMFCADSQEQKFSKMLSDVSSYFFTSKGELIFELQYDTGSAIFR